MRLWKRIQEGSQRLVSSPAEELSRWGRAGRFQLQLWRHCFRRLHRHNVIEMTSALAFRTIFALIPALILSLVLLNAFSLWGGERSPLQQFMNWTGLDQITVSVERSEGFEEDPGKNEEPRAATSPADVIVPEGGPQRIVLADWIERTVKRAQRKLSLGRVGPFGVLLLVWTVVTLLMTLEISLNRIFGAQRGRTFTRRMLLYWSVVTLGPMLLVTVLLAATAATRALAGVPGLGWLRIVVDWTGQLIAGVVLLTVVYRLMPNTYVRFRSAVLGALIAVPLWLVAKWGFALYVTRVGSSFYGALGIVPLFLFWISLTWVIFLFGAELAHTAVHLGILEQEELGRHTMLEPADLLAAAVVVAESYVAGQGGCSFDRVARRLNLPDGSLKLLFARLEREQVVCETRKEGEPAYVLARPPEQIEVSGILELGASGRPAPVERNYEDRIAKAVSAVRARAAGAMAGWTLADVVTSPKAPQAPHQGPTVT